MNDKKECIDSAEHSRNPENPCNGLLTDELVNDDEIKTFIDQIAISDDEAESTIMKIVADLKNSFKDYFPYKCLPFGSYVNGLRCTDSDVDLCLRISPLLSPGDQYPTLNKIKRYLYKNKTFGSIITIPKAKVPLVKFRHIATDVECDLSLDNEMGVQNTYLIKSYLSMNANLKTFVQILKYLLAKYYLRGSRKFTSVVLFWLVVFYMQQTDLLPPVMNARQSSETHCVISGWDCSIPKPLTTPINDPFSLRHHLQKFCEFYSNFNYAGFVICPYLACEIPTENFIQLKLPQNFFVTYLEKIENASAFPFPLHVINLQDPTSLNVNLTKSIPSSMFHAFKVLCETLHDYLSRNLNTKFTDLLNRINPKFLPIKYSHLKSVIPNKLKKKKKRKVDDLN